MHKVTLPDSITGAFMKRIVLILIILLLLGTTFMSFTADDSDHAVHPHHKALKNEDGSWKYTNALSKESSPYLLQHAHNPVRWYPWNEETFALARKTGKPIFLSIGYSTCYWCHVMERLVFESPDIAKVMNEYCINVKVDREERPDVDDIYMAAVQMLNNGRGGWPMSVFLTPPGAKGKDDPGLKPFFAGTYFPPQQFLALVARVGEEWKDQKEVIVAQADKVAAAIANHLDQQLTPGDVSTILFDRTAQIMEGTFDDTHGGFGGAPKFPTPNNLLLLMKAYQKAPTPELWHAISYTLERMARGGIYDQVAGGFHRYSVDEKWLVPHFEKMLYDNAQLVEVYLIAQSIKPDAKDPALYDRIAREVLDYVLREMTDPTGTFWSAQDAEVDAKEGQNYVWTADQVKAVIKDEKLAALALKMYGLDLGPNFQDPHDRNADPVNVIFLPKRLDEIAAAQKITMDDLLKKRADINAHLKKVRDARKQPRLDDKTLTSWNGLMIAAMARAGRQLKEEKYTAAARKAADYILASMRTKDGGLFRTMRQGKAKISGFLDDYTFFVHGLLQLHETTGDAKYLKVAEELTSYASKHFSSEGGSGGYYDTLAGQSDLFVRVRSTYDGATPSGNGVMLHNLLTLHERTKDERYLKHALIDLRAFAVPLRRQSMGMSHTLHALQRAAEIAPKQFAEAAVAAAKPVEPTDKEPVVASIDRTKVDLSKGDVTLKITMKVHKDYHVNANDPGDESVIPCVVKLQGTKNIEAIIKYPKGVKKKFAFAEKPLGVYEDTRVFEVTLKKGKAASATGAKLVLEYQACNDNACLMPAEAVFVLELSGLE